MADATTSPRQSVPVSHVADALDLAVAERAQAGARWNRMRRRLRIGPA
jgi:hypothetical protein